MPVREGVINNDLMSSNNGHHGWFPRSPRSLWRPPRDHSAQFLSLLLSFYARRYLPVSLLPFSSSSSVSALLSPLSTTANIHPRSRCWSLKPGILSHTRGSFALFPSLSFSRGPRDFALPPRDRRAINRPARFPPLVIYTVDNRDKLKYSPAANDDGDGARRLANFVLLARGDFYRSRSLPDDHFRFFAKASSRTKYELGYY